MLKLIFFDVLINPSCCVVKVSLERRFHAFEEVCSFEGDNFVDKFFVRDYVDIFDEEALVLARDYFVDR